MKPILNTEDIRKLKTDERLIECSCGKVNYYRFLCFHPRNTNYVILLNHCEEPERFFIQNLIDRFYTNYTSRDIILIVEITPLRNSKSLNKRCLN